MTEMPKGGIFLDFSAKYDSPLGQLLLLSDGAHLTGLYMGRAVPEESDDLPVFETTKAWLEDYFRGRPREVDIPLRLMGTEFQQLIWKLLLTIPYGTTKTYGQLAREAAVLLGMERMSAQAVGQAVGKNPISILVPCHRCMGAGDRLTGYAGGIENKLWLLRHEGWKGEGKL